MEDSVEITCALSRMTHVVTDENYVRAIRLGSRGMRAECGFRVRPAALATPQADVKCPACAAVTAARAAS